MQPLALFPLGTVLLPSGRLPLQIFEPRYVQLLRDLVALPVDERLLGIVAIRRGHEVGAGQAGELHPVGCVARIEHIAIDPSGMDPSGMDPSGIDPSGMALRFGVMLVGQRAFGLERIDDTSDKPYAVGEVTLLDDGGHVAEPELASLADVHRNYLEALGARPCELTRDPVMAAYDAAEKSLLTLQDKQRLLETREANERVEAVATMLRRETALVRRFGAVPRQSPPGGSGLN